MMQRIPLEKATEEMVSAKNIRLPDGSYLVRIGDKLEEGQRRRLERTGITSVVVQGLPVPGFDMGYDPERIVQRIPHLFRNFQNNPKMMQFSLLLTKILAERYK